MSPLLYVPGPEEPADEKFAEEASLMAEGLLHAVRHWHVLQHHPDRQVRAEATSIMRGGLIAIGRGLRDLVREQKEAMQ